MNNDNPRKGEIQLGISYLENIDEQTRLDRLKDFQKISELYKAVANCIDDANVAKMFEKEIQLLKDSYKDARLNITDKKEQEQRIAMIDGVYDKLMSEITSVKSMNNSIDSRQK